MKVLVTGSAGFIGFHLVKKLVESNVNVIGIDNINNYYDVELKLSRLKYLENQSQNNYKFFKLDICDYDLLKKLFEENKFDVVINLAAQAGVRYSIKNPKTYIDSNLVGFHNILEMVKLYNTNHFIFASSSSVYGLTENIPFSLNNVTDLPISLYAATKKSNEVMAFSYSHLFNIKTTGLRFFTVYGPFGRPDMAYFKFVKAINNDEIIDVYNEGNMLRDFTYIDDIVDALEMIIRNPPKNIKHRDSESTAPYRIFNIGNNKPIELNKFIQIIEENLNKKAIRKNLPMQQGDVLKTYADISELINEYSYNPKTSIEDGIKKFISWYINYYEGDSK